MCCSVMRTLAPSVAVMPLHVAVADRLHGRPAGVVRRLARRARRQQPARLLCGIRRVASGAGHVRTPKPCGRVKRCAALWPNRPCEYDGKAASLQNSSGTHNVLDTCAQPDHVPLVQPRSMLWSGVCKPAQRQVGAAKLLRARKRVGSLSGSHADQQAVLRARATLIG